jgi:carbon storage regulator CsrA
MLVLMRRKGEVIVIGNDIRIKVTRALRDRVYLGITVPPGVRVDRAKVQDGRRKAARCPRR